MRNIGSAVTRRSPAASSPRTSSRAGYPKTRASSSPSSSAPPAPSSRHSRSCSSQAADASRPPKCCRRRRSAPDRRPPRGPSPGAELEQARREPLEPPPQRHHAGPHAAGAPGHTVAPQPTGARPTERAHLRCSARYCKCAKRSIRLRASPFGQQAQSAAQTWPNVPRSRPIAARKAQTTGPKTLGIRAIRRFRICAS